MENCASTEQRRHRLAEHLNKDLAAGSRRIEVQNDFQAVVVRRFGVRWVEKRNRVVIDEFGHVNVEDLGWSDETWKFAAVVAGLILLFILVLVTG
jgi:hypothetical protein